MNLQVEDKRALVSGSRRGIGEAIAKTLAAEGAAIVVHGRDETKTRRVADEITQSGGRAAIAIGDLASDAEAQRVADAALSAFGSIDILINNARVFRVRGWWDTAPAQWIEIYNQNVAGSVRLIQAFAPPMRECRWGRIVQISSGMGLLPSPQMADYAATKIVNILTTVSLSLELADSGVTANTVSPGPIRTPGADDFFNSMAHQRGHRCEGPDAGYEPGGPIWHMNHVEPHLRTIFNFVGITDLRFVYSGNDEFGGDRLERSLEAAARRVVAVAAPMAAMGQKHDGNGDVPKPASNGESDPMDSHNPTPEDRFKIVDALNRFASRQDLRDPALLSSAFRRGPLDLELSHDL
jgi:3-oxoacyl-[acyl-carrier protein] reductase